MIKIEAIKEKIEIVQMIFCSKKCFCLDFNKLKKTLLLFFRNKTIEKIKNDKKCCVLKNLYLFKKIKKICKLTKEIEDIFVAVLSEQNIFKIKIDKCQRVIGYFTQQEDIYYFNIFLYDPFHQFNIFHSNERLNKTALIHIYDFSQISNFCYKEIKKNINQNYKKESDPK